MAGKYTINQQTVASIQAWLDTLGTPDGWHGNNLHIDEVHGFKKIKRRDWVRCSFSILPLMLHLADQASDLRYFLHVGLLDSQSENIPNRIDVEWLTLNVHLYTPPSLYACSRECFDDDYKPSSLPLELDSSLQISGVELSTCFRSIYNAEEKHFEQDLYFFADRLAGFEDPIPQVTAGSRQDPLSAQKYELIVYDLPGEERAWYRELELTVRFQSGEVYEATAFTIRYIKVNIHRRGAGYFWAKDMLIVSDLKDKTLQRAVEKSIQEGYFEEIFSKVNGHSM